MRKGGSGETYQVVSKLFFNVLERTREKEKQTHSSEMIRVSDSTVYSEHLEVGPRVCPHGFENCSSLESGREREKGKC